MTPAAEPDLAKHIGFLNFIIFSIISWITHALREAYDEVAESI